jgi:hypothetical protein
VEGRAVISEIEGLITIKIEAVVFGVTATPFAPAAAKGAKARKLFPG